MIAGGRVAAVSLVALCGFESMVAASVSDRGETLGERIAASEAVIAAEAQRLLDAGVASVSVSLLAGDEVVSATVYGYANVYTGATARVETVYNVASTLKPVTATAVLKLVERDALRLEEPVGTYLPEFDLRDSDGKPVKVRHLLDHTSALTPNTNMVDLWSRQAPDSLTEIISSLKVQSTPGETFEYNNVAFAVAGLLVERVSGMAFEDYLRTEILDPLGISSSPFRPTPTMVERLALPYEPSEDGMPAPVAQTRVDVFPAGDAYFTASEMARLLCLHVNAGRCGKTVVLKPETVSQMQQPGIGDYGLGWGLLPDGDRLLIGHGGGIPGYTSFLLGDSEQHLGVAALATSGDLSRLARAALQVLRGEGWVPPEERQVVEVPEKVLAEYVGVYEVQPGVTIEIGLDAGVLYALVPGGNRLEIRPESESRFFLLQVEGTLTFLREDGKVVALDLDPGGTARRID